MDAARRNNRRRDVLLDTALLIFNSGRYRGTREELVRLADSVVLIEAGRVVAAGPLSVPTVVGKKMYVRDKKNIMALDLG